VSRGRQDSCARLTIAGGVRDAWSDWLRGRGKRLCARVARPALLCGPSASPLDLCMGPTPFRSALRNWPQWLGLTAVGEILWFSVLYPLVPRTLRAACVLALIPLPLAGYVYLVVHLLRRLADAQWNLRVRQGITLVLAVSVGCVGFVLVWITETHFDAEVGYFLMHRR
jgi:hypothetical protein